MSSYRMVKAQNRDEKFLLFMLGSIHAWIIALSAFLYSTLAPPIVVNRLIGPHTYLIVAVGFALFGLLLYAAARKQILNNESMQAVTGCPLCQQRELVRIRRTQRDRLTTLSTIRVARYQCRNCSWSGLRILNNKNSRRRIMRQQRVAVKTAEVPPKTVSASESNGTTLFSSSPPIETNSSTDSVVDIKKVEPTAEFTFTLKEFKSPNIIPERRKGDVKPAIGFGDHTVAEDQVKVRSRDTRVTNDPTSSSNGPLNTVPEEGGRSILPIDPTDNVAGLTLEEERALALGGNAKIMASSGVYLRARPRTHEKKVCMLEPDTVVSLLRAIRRDDGEWFYVKAGRKVGWVSESYLKTIS